MQPLLVPQASFIPGDQDDNKEETKAQEKDADGNNDGTIRHELACIPI